MRFNAKELLAVAVQPSYKFDKEGILLLRERQEGLFRKSDVFTERWCRLRGNLLFYYKSKDQYSEPSGVFVLEQCVVKLDTNGEVPFSFSLVFQGEEHGHQLAASTESDRDSWIQSLHMASYEYMRCQLSSLKEKLQKKKADTDWVVCQSSASKRQRSFMSLTGCYDPLQFEPFLELSVSCDNLKCDGDGQPPNPLVCICINTPPSTRWVKFAQTEIVEKSSNPCFLTTVTFNKTDVMDLTKVKMSVYDVRERVTCTSTLLGEALFTLCTLIQNDRHNLRLTLISPSCSSVGFITVSVREITCSNQRNGWTQFRESDSSWPKVDRPRSYSLPTRLTSQVGIPVLGQLKTLYTSFTTQTYRFHTGLGAELYVHEIMAESKLSFTFPQLLLNLWINDEKKLMDNILHLGELNEEWQQKQLNATERHLQLINHYTETLNFLASQQQTCSFKPSTRKKDTSLEFLPVNLHLQRMWVQNVTTRKTGIYDILTVGAFSAFPHRFRQGGLLRLLNQMKSSSPLVSKDIISAILGPDRISRAAETITRIEQLQEEIEEELQKLLIFARQKSRVNMQSIVNSLSSKGNQLTHLCIPELVEEALSSWEKMRPIAEITEANSDANTSLKNGESSDNQSQLIKSTSDNALSSTVENSSQQNGVKDTLDGLNFTAENDINTLVSTTSNGKEFDSVCPLEKNVEIQMESDTLSIMDSSEVKQDNLIHLNNTSEDTSYDCKLPSPNGLPDELEPLDLTHLNIKASIMCMASKIHLLSSQQKNEGKNSDTGYQAKCSDWTVELKPSIKKLRQAILCLQKTANLTYGLVSVKEPSPSSALCQTIRYRRDVVFSQALTALVAGLMTRLWCQLPDAAFLHMMRAVGILAHFEGLLSCYGDEMGALEDMLVGVDDLRRVLFWLEPSQCTSNPQPRVEGNRLFLSVIIPAPQSVMDLLPKECSKGCRFTVTSVFFNVGINEQATLAERFGDVSLQEKINKDSLNILKEHFNRLQRASKAEKVQGFRAPGQQITELLDELQNQVHARRSKNVEILHLAAEICCHLGGIRFTSCKSAKDRTSMSVTLEQTMVLQKDFNLEESEVSRALDCMRSEGTRRENALKNVGVRKYAFTSLQLVTLPKLYRPPAGTFGNVQS